MVQVIAEDVDKYGRTVGRVQIEGQEVAELMLQSGYAWFYNYFCKLPQCHYWKTLETQARASKTGL